MLVIDLSLVGDKNLALLHLVINRLMSYGPGIQSKHGAGLLKYSDEVKARLRAINKSVSSIVYIFLNTPVAIFEVIEATFQVFRNHWTLRGRVRGSRVPIGLLVPRQNTRGQICYMI
jgi:hypothetical protein